MSSATLWPCVCCTQVLSSAHTRRDQFEVLSSATKKVEKRARKTRNWITSNISEIGTPKKFNLDENYSSNFHLFLDISVILFEKFLMAQDRSPRPVGAKLQWADGIYCPLAMLTVDLRIPQTIRVIQPSPNKIDILPKISRTRISMDCFHH